MSKERPLVPEEGDSTDAEELVQELKGKLHKGEIVDPEYLKHAIRQGFYSVEDMEAAHVVMGEIVTMQSDFVSLLEDAILDDRSKHLVLESLHDAGEEYVKRFSNLQVMLDKSVRQRLKYYKKEKDGK